jgi:hypothetical protein
MTVHRAVITFTGDDGDEQLAAVTLDVDDLHADPWHAQIVSNGARTPRGSAGNVTVTIGAREAPASIGIVDGRVATIEARGPFVIR